MDGKSKSRMLSGVGRVVRRVAVGGVVCSVAGVSLFFLLRGFASETGLKLPVELGARLPKFMPFSRSPEVFTTSAALSAESFASSMAEREWIEAHQSPPRKLNEVGSVEALVLALKNDDVCAAARSLSGFEPAFNAAGALAKLGRSFGPFDELLGESSPLRGRVLEDSRQRPTRFFNALLLAGLLEGSPAHSVDPQQAREILLGLEHEDPRNGAYPFFRLAVEKSLGVADRELRETVRDIARAERFETFLTEMAREIHKLGWETPSLFLFTRSLLATYPVPNFLQSKNVLKSLAETADMRSELNAIAKLLMKEGETAERGFQSYGFFPLEYEVGRNIWRSFLDTSVEPLPPDYKELSAAKENRNPNGPTNSPWPSYPWPDDQKVSTTSCNRRAYEDFFAEYRHRF